MVKKLHDKEYLRKQHAEICPKYSNLSVNIKQALNIILDNAGIEVLDIRSRIKEFESFWDKIQRKGYQEPFQDIEDICGVRIISYYPSDLEKISALIHREFNVIESIDKVDTLGPDKFGYRSIHFVVTIKDEWLSTPNYRGLSDIKAEIQVRTILMHAWADIEQKLAYKKAEYVPEKFRRNLARISAILEEADERLDSLRQERENYIETLISGEAKESGRFDINQEMSLDSLQAFLDFYFEDRGKSIKETALLLDEIMENKVSIRELVQGLEMVREFLPKMEKESFRIIPSQTETGLKLLPGKRWAQVGIARHILDITHDKYWKYREEIQELPEYVVQDVERWRVKLSSSK